MCGVGVRSDLPTVHVTQQQLERRQVPLLVFHGAYTEGLDEARRRRGCVSTNDAAVALLFAKMAANSALRRQFQQT